MAAPSSIGRRFGTAHSSYNQRGNCILYKLSNLKITVLEMEKLFLLKPTESYTKHINNVYKVES
jgi:hypothetical protein